jgi:hypothetical protein
MEVNDYNEFVKMEILFSKKMFDECEKVSILVKKYLLVILFFSDSIEIDNNKYNKFVQRTKRM